MTDPLDDYPMPFSIPHNHGAVGGYSLVVPVEYRLDGGQSTSSVPLPPGRSMVTFTWDGAESLRYALQRKINGVWKSLPYITVIEPGVAGVPRSSSPISIVSSGVNETSVFLQTAQAQSQATVDAGARASVDVVTIPPKLIGT